MTNMVEGEGKSLGNLSRRAYYFPKVTIMERVKSYRWVIIDSFLKEYDHFRRAINGMPPSIASASGGLRAIAIADRAGVASPSQLSEHAISTTTQVAAGQEGTADR